MAAGSQVTLGSPCSSVLQSVKRHCLTALQRPLSFVLSLGLSVCQ